MTSDLPARADLSGHWAALDAELDRVEPLRMADLFEADPDRAARMTMSGAGITLDYSKNRIDAAALKHLLDLARAAGVPAWRAAMFAGKPINTTEGRKVLHVALRDRSGALEAVTGLVPGTIANVRERCYALARAVRAGDWRGHTGQPIQAVVNIGIGGSDLGPAMACRALRIFATPDIAFRFVSNVDGTSLDEALSGLDPATTLFIVASKTFTTDETLTNAKSARDWFIASGAPASAVARHFVAVSTNSKEVAAFGIAPENMFGFWDFVGGRYSIWSAIGLSLMIAIGPERFDEFLDGAHAMDQHFLTTPLEQNLPVLMAVLGVWYRNQFECASHAVLPYSESLSRFPAYLQQLEMESNGKGVALDGADVPRATGPIVWGEAGTNGQHAFHQLLHQGPDWVPIDFILPIRHLGAFPAHQTKLIANCLAQSSALMLGKTRSEVEADLRAGGMAADEAARLAAHRAFPGNRPSNTLLIDALDPARFGALIALYEHKVFTQSIIWGINAFDQWGVELGKVAAKGVEAALRGGGGAMTLDPSTLGLIANIRKSWPLCAELS
ncbi:MAG: glucose-6-phosphate isomerase [Burkholderiales bacterium]|nr:glucose-6-phosphate isomerase [Burkholderiales bacterium]